MYSIDFNKYNKKYRLRERINGKNKHLGYFDTIGELESYIQEVKRNDQQQNEIQRRDN